MALNKKTVERLLNKLDDLQKQIESIHNELLIELDGDENDFELTEEEIAEIKAIRKRAQSPLFYIPMFCFIPLICLLTARKGKLSAYLR